MVESISATPPAVPQKSASVATNPFTNVSLAKSSKLAALEGSGTNSYVIVSSPTVGSFRRGRTVKGKKQPPICKEGDVIKEGQVIGYLDQFGNELPVKSDVAGEILKLLYKDGGNFLISVSSVYVPISMHIKQLFMLMIKLIKYLLFGQTFCGFISLMYDQISTPCLC
eukprot:TRINITY_DN14190_c0_g1_i1.p1 TRINITY_DN14190_c0_g1~~TRINITY_DN14190_c0_g1_i1.p1  ORF type:complete len:177 (-),score=23.65 TRINITY_DN14190_c0_g1_i1:1160-1663(-)